ncbi:hypothetical protein CCR75_001788 [Bremia lactucae]|uniref:carbonic anhydrase n=1 Tax=Bremia lactucae TaxID=4779 RepID=A0A976FRL7_BRELC|nr:hypothetical protein CCR75_001788 [Bremia lactucae]
MKCIASIAAALVIHDLFVSAIDFSGPVVQNTKPARWGYRISDPRMVDCDRWADQWETCGGVRQSPINIVPSKTVQRQKNPLVFSGMCSHFNLSAPHEPLQANQLGGNCGVYLQDVFYMLAHFHLHAPSEHTINGKAMSGEIHFVHKSSVSDDLLVIGVFLVIDVTSDPWLAPLLDALEQVNSAAQTEAVLVQL